MAKSRAQQAAIAISMKKAGKKPALKKAQSGLSIGQGPNQTTAKSNINAKIAAGVATAVGTVGAAITAAKAKKAKKAAEKAKEELKKEVAEKGRYGGAKKSLPKAQDGNIIKNRADAFRRLNQNSREDILKSIESSKKIKERDKQFYDSLPPVEKGMVRAPYSSDYVYPEGKYAENQLKYRDAAETYLRDYDKANPIGTLKTKAATPIQKKGGATKAAYKKGGAVKVTAKKVMMKKDGGNIDDPKSATPQPKVYSSKKEFRKDLKNAKMNAKVEAAKSRQSKDWAGKATAAAGAGSAILGLVEGAKRLFEKKPSEKNGGYMKKGGVVKKATAKKTIVKSKKK